MYKRILVAVDGSDTSDSALKTAIGLAKDQKASLRILHVADLSPATLAVADMPVADPDLLDKIGEAIQAGGQTILTRSLNEARAASVEADTSLKTFRIPVGQVSDVIEEEAELWNADLIIVGTHGRRGFRRLILGSVAESLARISTKPVLLVRAQAAPLRQR
ncbi:MAG TPA: universal stress protein [Xanthobacteraceae bacterium]|nr:universal stress protein [Xanthobacteraceae bacterium]